MLIFSPCAIYRVQFDFHAKNFSEYYKASQKVFSPTTEGTYIYIFYIFNLYHRYFFFTVSHLYQFSSKIIILATLFFLNSTQTYNAKTTPPVASACYNYNYSTSSVEMELMEICPGIKIFFSGFLPSELAFRE